MPALFHAQTDEILFRAAIGSAPTSAIILLSMTKYCSESTGGSASDGYFAVGHAQSWNAHNLDRLIVNKYPATSSQVSNIPWASGQQPYTSTNFFGICTYAVPTGVGSAYQVYEDRCLSGISYTHVACMTKDQYTDEYFVYHRDPSNSYSKSTPDNQITNQFPNDAAQHVENVFFSYDIPGTYYPQTNDNPFFVTYYWINSLWSVGQFDTCIEQDANGNCVPWSQAQHINFACVLDA